MHSAEKPSKPESNCDSRVGLIFDSRPEIFSNEEAVTLGHLGRGVPIAFLQALEGALAPSITFSVKQLFGSIDPTRPSLWNWSSREPLDCQRRLHARGKTQRRKP